MMFTYRYIYAVMHVSRTGTHYHVFCMNRYVPGTYISNSLTEKEEEFFSTFALKTVEPCNASSASKQASKHIIITDRMQVISFFYVRSERRI